MIGYIESLEKLGFPLGKELVTNVILQSLLNSFIQFVLNFNMNDTNKTLPQLLSMLQTAESNMKQAEPKPILMVRKNKGKGKPNEGYIETSRKSCQGRKMFSLRDYKGVGIWLKEMWTCELEMEQELLH
ncbi:hypothetical protein PVK06_043790 [Gossypium arboreum]|uniref:Uncharacterized protein n=1 Tax=Gossypium arboreum TaxID=29729 RepID=A0ABR0MPH9_GOSAR|nr:hypothetical protein PVK06_043790 [Gossypium arboreum]